MVSNHSYPYFPKKRKYAEWIKKCSNEAVSRQVSQSEEVLNLISITPTTVSSPPANRKEELWRPWDHRIESVRSEKEMKKPRELPILEETSMTKINLNEKVRSEKNLEKCKVCTLEFTRRDNLTRHIKSKHNLKTRPNCRFCLKILSRNDAVMRHEINCHQNPERRSKLIFTRSSSSTPLPTSKEISLNKERSISNCNRL